MTVVVAALCRDGVVIGADSQITDPDRGMSYPAQKLHPLGSHAAWGGSGARAVLGELERLFDEQAGAILEATDVGDALQERTLPVLRRHYENFIPEVPGQRTEATPSAYVLAAGMARGRRFLVEINPNGMVSRYEDVGFHAVGSSAPMAQQAGALLSHIDLVDRPVRHGVVGIVRVLDALRTTSPSVGLEIDVCRITADGAEHLGEQDIERAREDVARWREREAAVFDELFER